MAPGRALMSAPPEGAHQSGAVIRDDKTVAGFGYEWSKFDQAGAGEEELAALFNAYFQLFPWDALPPLAVGLDLGCGSGRWALFVADRTGMLLCVDPSGDAIKVACRNLHDRPQCRFIQSAAGELPLAAATLDFGYSLGVLHHTPDPQKALRDATAALKPGAPFLVYLYYALDGRPWWFRTIWRTSDLFRRLVSRSPTPLRYVISQILAVTVYWPMARLSASLEARGHNVASFPLSAYRDKSLYVMRTDALDRFGTRLEKRFTAAEVRDLMAGAGLERITVGRDFPYWCALGYQPGTTSPEATVLG
jgi:SAM-dependent methyltransferase